MAALTSAVTPCVISACPSAELAMIQSAADALCSCANSGTSPAVTSCYAVGAQPSGSIVSGIGGASTTAVAAATSTTKSISAAPSFTGGANSNRHISAGMVGAAILAVVAL